MYLPQGSVLLLTLAAALLSGGSALPIAQGPDRYDGAKPWECVLKRTEGSSHPEAGWSKGIDSGC